MKLLNKVSLAILSVVFTLVVLGSVANAALAPGAVDLDSAAPFAVLAGSAVTDSNPAAGIDIIGNVGLSPTGGASITGLSCTQITGTLFDTDAGYTGGFDANVACRTTNAGLLTAAKVDLALAYTDAENRAALPDIPTDLAAQNLTPGVYHSASGTFTITGGGTLTLDGGGDPDAVFIFQADTTLVTSAASSVVLTNGAQACNVFWQVGTSATLGTSTDFVGTIMAAASITDDGDSTVIGRFLADADNNIAGAVTLNNTDVTVPTCAPSLILNKVVVNTGGGTALNTAWTLTATGTGGAPTNLSGTTPVDSDVAFPDATFETDTYTLAEAGGPAGYTASTYSCTIDGGVAVVSNSITLDAGEDAICTITNTFVAPSGGGGGGGSSGSRRVVDEDDETLPASTSLATLHVIKQVINDNGGNAVAADFNLHVEDSDGDDILGSPAAGVSAPGIFYTVPAGSYTVSEDANSFYAQSFSGDCNSEGEVTLGSGDDETCTVINDDILGAVPILPASGLDYDSKIFWNILVLGVIILTLSLVYYLARRKKSIKFK